jgi:hypothetical protein
MHWNVRKNTFLSNLFRAIKKVQKKLDLRAVKKLAKNFNYQFLPSSYLSLTSQNDLRVNHAESDFVSSFLKLRFTFIVH